jgi:hypothetical protein
VLIGSMGIAPFDVSEALTEGERIVREKASVKPQDCDVQ